MSRGNNTFSIAHSESSLGWGGQEIRVLREMEAMRDRGHSLCLFAPRESRIFTAAMEGGFAVLEIDPRKHRYPAAISAAAGELRRRRVQIVNTHSSRDGWIVGIAARIARVPLLLRSRHIEVDYPNRFVSRIAFHRLPHHVLTTSGRISERLIGELGLRQDRVDCVPTGIDLAAYSPGVKGALHDELKLPGETPLIGMIAVLRSWKGHPDFLEAARQILGETQFPHFIIAGDGPGRDKLIKRIGDLGLGGHVHWIGHRSDVPRVIASLSAVVLPSYAHEGIPQILLQAQAMGKPVVGTAVGGIPEVVAHEETGLLVPPQNPNELARALLRLLRQPELARQLGSAAHAKAQAAYGIDRMCERLEAIYRQHLENAHA